MSQLVSVRFRFNPKPLWFDPKGVKYETGAEVLVETERGREVGSILDPAIDATDKQIAKLKSPLKPVIRELTDLDYEHIEALEEKGRQAMPFFRKKVEEYELDIKPVEVQYLFSGERAIFYFSSEERVDFRELVRDLAQHFHVRIDMRQIGARDEAKELGGLAHCGEEFCCSRFGGEFQPVSIRMAKEQDLPLNPTKISGACGRLMCCLRYEHEAYKDFKKRAPKKGTVVDTPLGEAVISSYNTPSEMMELKLEDGKRINVPLAEMDCHKGKDGISRCSVDHTTIERCATRSILIALGSLDQQTEDALASETDTADIDLTLDIGGSERKRRRRSSKASERSASTKEVKPTEPNASVQGSEEKVAQGTRKRRRRSSASTTTNQDASPQKKAQSQPQRQQQSQRKKQNKPAATAKTETQGSARSSEGKPRPGQRSSGLRKPRNRTSSDNERQTTQNPSRSSTASRQTDQARQTDSSRQSPTSANTSSRSDTRRRRRRHTGSGNSVDSGDTNASSNG